MCAFSAITSSIAFCYHYLSGSGSTCLSPCRFHYASEEDFFEGAPPPYMQDILLFLMAKKTSMSTRDSGLVPGPAPGGREEVKEIQGA